MMKKNKVILGGIAGIALIAVFIWGSGLGGNLMSSVIFGAEQRTMASPPPSIPENSCTVTMRQQVEALTTKDLTREFMSSVIMSNNHGRAYTQFRADFRAAERRKGKSGEITPQTMEPFVLANTTFVRNEVLRVRVLNSAPCPPPPPTTYEEMTLPIGSGYGSFTPRLFQEIKSIYYARKDRVYGEVFRLDLSTLLLPNINNVVLKSGTLPVYAYCGFDTNTKIAECILATVQNGYKCVDWQIMAESGAIQDVANLHICPSTMRGPVVPPTTDCIWCYKCSSIQSYECSNECKTGEACTPENNAKQEKFNKLADELAQLIANSPPNDPKIEARIKQMTEELMKLFDDADYDNLLRAAAEGLQHETINIDTDKLMGNSCDDKQIQAFKFKISGMRRKLESIREMCAEKDCNIEVVGLNSDQLKDDAIAAMKIIDTQLGAPNLTEEQRSAFLKAKEEIKATIDLASKLTNDCSEQYMKEMDAQLNAVYATAGAGIATVLTMGACSPLLISSATSFTLVSGASLATTSTGLGAMIFTGISSTYAFGQSLPLLEAYLMSESGECTNFFQAYAQKNNPETRKAIVMDSLIYGAGGGAAIKGFTKLPRLIGLMKKALIKPKITCSTAQKSSISNINEAYCISRLNRK